ncbi:NAD(P)/FAD-dependent oxidoreductase [Vibrio sp. ZSDE26]|uniref:NAD(P)/FAD-dependent oxidoreductase n=1 Tax=Vibrio amylolyticus TaxID=2847292 RepID=A0A9X1XMG2_9VIBR|nr:NAD(P)/FAD-dependent oxidoreductase [Vibrio amylolyticus]MCK6264358.1 NAD(P)/FAD-dependent oxidoreductase [Vibrio amylolyticus]
MERESAQVVIVGAGPSGSVASALLNQQGINVVVIEKATFPRFSIGESLLPACMEIIEKAGMKPAVEAAQFQFKDGAAFRCGGRYTEFDFQDKFTDGPCTTFQVQRGSFDKILADCAQKLGVEIRYQHELESIEFKSNHSILSVVTAAGHRYQMEAQYVLDASGFGRVLPKLLDLETPSCLPPRKALFTHLVDNIDTHQHNHYDRNKILVSVHPKNPDVWYWLIPFSNGISSFGIVGEPAFFDDYSQEGVEAIQQLVKEEPLLSSLLSQADYPNPAGELGGYSANVKHLATDHYALLGNAGEFLDPVFSSGVTIAMKSAEFASECVARQLKGEKVDWNDEYATPLMIGVDAFRTYVEGWYDGSLQDVIFHQDPNARIKQMICSILAGYAWDDSNPYVKDSKRRLSSLAEFIRQEA